MKYSAIDSQLTRTPPYPSSMLYLTTLQFDGVMLSYLKSELRLSDMFISVMRGVTVIAGLLGTVVMPYGERWVGLERTGAWSIW